MSERYLKADAATVAAEIEKLRNSYPEAFEDHELALDTIEGETEFFRIIKRTVNEKLDADTMVSALKERESDIRDRRSRFERKSEGYKAIIQLLMNAADRDKLVLPEATIIVTAPRTKVEITNIDDIPQGYARIEKKPDLVGIKKALDAGENIPGAALTIGAHGLMIRSK